MRLSEVNIGDSFVLLPTEKFPVKKCVLLCKKIDGERTFLLYNSVTQKLLPRREDTVDPCQEVLLLNLDESSLVLG
tara:strand:- start:586 stop:813 length:228 start_codon:yes stop_codon:yes gene_type:complete